MSYWDVPERPLEPPEDKPVGYCGFCGGEVYGGDTVYRIDGQLIHEDCLGDIVAEASGSSEYPGIWISLHQPGEDYEPSLALVEFTMTEADVEGPALITRVWGDGKQEEYTGRVVHTGLEKGGAADEH